MRPAIIGIPSTPWVMLGEMMNRFVGTTAVVVAQSGVRHFTMVGCALALDSASHDAPLKLLLNIASGRPSGPTDRLVNEPSVNALPPGKPVRITEDVQFVLLQTAIFPTPEPPAVVLVS